MITGALLTHHQDATTFRGLNEWADRHVYTESLDHDAVDLLAASLTRCAVTFRSPQRRYSRATFWRPLVQRVRVQFGAGRSSMIAGLQQALDQSQESSRRKQAIAFLTGARLFAMFVEREVGSRAKRRCSCVSCEYDHFAKVQTRERGERTVIGYYGAIADWFDTDLVRTWRRDIRSGTSLWSVRPFADLGGSKNVERLTTGRAAVRSLPRWIEQFDVLILPSNERRFAGEIRKGI